MATGRPILVTGAHRSGTTWVGSILAACGDTTVVRCKQRFTLPVRYLLQRFERRVPQVCYIQEPFHPGRRSGACRARFTRWFTYVCRENESRFLEPFRDTLRLRYDLLGMYRGLRPPYPPQHHGGALPRVSVRDVPRLLLRSIREYARSVAYRALGRRPLVKDPIALFSAEWLASRFDMDVVIVIRHPAGFASSLARLGWTFPFSHLLEQPLLMRDLLHPFEAEIRKWGHGKWGHDAGTAKRASGQVTSTSPRSALPSCPQLPPGDILDQAALLWRIMHHVIAGYRTRHPGWTFVRHEDLSRNPVREFDSLCGRLGLGLSGRARDLIAETTDPANPADPADPHSLRRDSRAGASIWKERLAPAEVRRIRAGVGDVSELFYSDADWE